MWRKTIIPKIYFYRELLLISLKTSYKGSYIGALWIILTPIIHILTYVIFLVGIRGRVDNLLHLITSVVLFQVIAKSLGSAKTEKIQNFSLYSNTEKSHRTMLKSSILKNLVPSFLVLLFFYFLINISNIIFNFNQIQPIDLQTLLIITASLPILFIYLNSLVVLINKFSSNFTDFNQALNFITRYMLFTSPVFWSGITGISFVDYFIKLTNPVYFYFQFIYNTINKSIGFDFFSLLFPSILFLLYLRYKETITNE